MRARLKQLNGKRVVLANDAEFWYTVEPYQVKNVLGFEVAELHQYTFLTDGYFGEAPPVKLYRTIDGNWYDLEESKTASEMKIIRALKSVIEKMETPSQIRP
jgi:hypothetical protein